MHRQLIAGAVCVVLAAAGTMPREPMHARGTAADPLVVTDVKDLPHLVVHHEFRDKADSKGEVDGYELSGALAVPGAIVLVDNENKRLELALDGSGTKEPKKHSLFSLSAPGGRPVLSRLWSDQFEAVRKGYDDLEGVTRSGGHLYFLGSHSASEDEPGKFIARKERHVVLRLPFGDKPTGAAQPSASFMPELLELAKGQGWPSETLKDKDTGDMVTVVRGINFEGIAAEPGAASLLLGLRGPLTKATKAVVLRWEKPDLAFGGAPEVKLLVADTLDLGGLGIRDLFWDQATGSYLVAAGPSVDDRAAGTSLWQWRPKDNSLRKLLQFQGLAIEGVARLTDAPWAGHLLLTFDQEDKTAPKKLQFGRLAVVKTIDGL